MIIISMRKQKQLARLIVSGSYSRYNSPQSPQHSYSTLEKDGQQDKINHILTNKYRTFTKWNLRKSLPQKQKKLSLFETPNKESSSLISNNQSLKLKQFNTSGIKSPKQQFMSKYISSHSPIKNSQSKSSIKKKTILQQKLEKLKARNISPMPPKKQEQQSEKKATNNLGPISVEQLAVKSDRRQRFKKLRNPMQFIKHYIQKQNFSPSTQQKQLISQLVLVQKILQTQQPDLEHILKKIYRLMNLAVDYNQLKFLALIILLAADICFYRMDLSRAFHFYNQTRIAGSYAHLDNLKISALIGMAKIAFYLQNFQASTKFFKKALQYAWRVRDQDTELQVYDWLGQTLHLEGKARESLYYHVRFSNNEIQGENSSLKRVSREILQDYDSYILSLEDSNLNSLFIEYLNLPIGKDLQLKKSSDKVFINYKDGESPRMRKSNSFLGRENVFDVKVQIPKSLNEDYEFKSEITNPDTHQNFTLIRKFGKHKNQLDFEHSLEYNKIIGFKKEKVNINQILKLPLEIQVQQKLEERMDPLWWEKMVSEARQRRTQKLGALKERVRNSHLSSHKYPNQRKKKILWSTDKINQSFNRTLLDFIDPNVPQALATLSARN